jgi:hypothetical protein
LSLSHARQQRAELDPRDLRVDQQHVGIDRLEQAKQVVAVGQFGYTRHSRVLLEQQVQRGTHVCRWVGHHNPHLFCTPTMQQPGCPRPQASGQFLTWPRGQDSAV